MQRELEARAREAARLVQLAPPSRLVRTHRESRERNAPRRAHREMDRPQHLSPAPTPQCGGSVSRRLVLLAPRHPRPPPPLPLQGPQTLAPPHPSFLGYTGVCDQEEGDIECPCLHLTGRGSGRCPREKESVCGWVCEREGATRSPPFPSSSSSSPRPLHPNP